MRLTLICLALLATEPAHALSCLRPDAVRLFEQAREAEEDYVIVKGQLTFLEAPNAPPRGSKLPALTKARIDGHVLNRAGFPSPFSRPITVSASCFAHWCGSLDGISEHSIFAIRLTDAGLTLDIGPCGGDRVTWSQSGEERLLRCYRNGDCQIPAQ